MTKKLLIPLLALTHAGSLLTACGGDGSDTTDTAPPDDTASPADAAGSRSRSRIRACH